MANKFQRNYSISITPNNGSSPIIIQPPFTIELDITRNVLNSLNNAVIRIYNLSIQHRNLILKDFYDNAVNRILVVQAGYGSAVNLPTIFYGTIFSAFSKREGQNYITEITAQSGGFAIPKVYSTQLFPAKTTDQVVIQSLVTSLASQSGLNVGYIGNFPNVSKTSRSFSQPIYDALQELTGNGVFIDDTFINCLNNGESIPTDNPITVNSSTGLLGTPAREQHNMIIPVLFSPEIKPGQLINLQSTTIESVVSNTSAISSSFNGIQKVNSVHHVGMISSAVCGDLVTEIGVIWGIPAVAS